MFKKEVFKTLLRVSGQCYSEQMREIQKIKTSVELQTFNEKYLQNLLTHAYGHVSYYQDILKDITKNNEIQLDSFAFLPLLSKETLRTKNEALLSNDIKKRKWQFNTSGGSTGEPVKFAQDTQLSKWVHATLEYYYNNIIGLDELKIKKVILWGSERDIFLGSAGIKAKIINWLENQKMLNSFLMTESTMKKYAQTINTYKPELIRGYAGSLYELSKFIEKNQIKMHSPKAIISAAEVLTPEIRKKIENVFQTKVFNFYGSREVPAIAGECRCGLMHVFSFNNYLEVLNRQNMPAKQGEVGKIVLTSLHNYSMPLIRYELGDIAEVGSEKCQCGNPLPTLNRVIGRVTDNFLKADGTIIYGEYFTHLFYHKDWVRLFQVIQEDYKIIKIRIVLQKSINPVDQQNIDKKIKLVMGNDCKIIWNYVKDIKKTRNGKYLYTKSLIYKK